MSESSMAQRALGSFIAWSVVYAQQMVHERGVRFRYRPTIRRPPSEANLRRARERLYAIRQQIEVGTFSFADEFPDYRFLRRVSGSARVRSCNDVFDDFLAHCEVRFAKDDLAAATLMSYRRLLNRTWRPALGK